MIKDADIDLLIARHFPGARVHHITPLMGGVSADVVRVELVPDAGGPQSIVLRIHGPTHSGHDAAVEFELLRALHRAGVCVPEPLFVEASCRQYPHPYLAMEFVEGTTALGPAQVDHGIDAMADMLFSLHQTPVAALPALPLRIDPLTEIFDFLPGGPEWDGLRRQLSALEDTAFVGEPVLLHGDFWPENLIWQDGQIKSVLDWEDAALGDPLSDVACTGLELCYAYGDSGADRFFGPIESMPMWTGTGSRCGRSMWRRRLRTLWVSGVWTRSVKTTCGRLRSKPSGRPALFWRRKSRRS